MSYTVLSAAFANEERNAAVLRTIEAGDVLVSAVDTPDLWAILPEDVEAFQPLAIVPQAVTKRQALQVLILHGLDEQVEARLAAMPGIEGKLARAEWRESNTVERHRPLVVQMLAALGLTPEQGDALFIEAGALP